jgi:molecular chaperone GrpE (heat shock protein)
VAEEGEPGAADQVGTRPFGPQASGAAIPDTDLPGVTTPDSGPPDAGEPARVPSADTVAEDWASGGEGDDVDEPADAESGLGGGLGAVQAVALERLAGRLDELVRLRHHDAELVDRLHAENSRLRAGELTEAMAPLLRGLIRLHDQMGSLGADDPQSVAGILRKQLLQVLDFAVDVRPYTAVPGGTFDPARHLGVRRVPTDDPSRDGTIARTVRPGFVRGETTVVRPAETEVYRAR